MFTVGVIGPSSSVARILTAARNLESNINFVQYPYEEIKDTKEIIEKYSNQVDIWLFSGKVSYLIACDVLASREKLIYIEHTESGIYKGLLQFSYQQNIFLDQISIDELSSTHLDNALKQLNITSKQVYIKTFDFKTNTSELLDFHRGLWEKGKIKGVLTCFQEVYHSLRKLGIPTYRISTTDMEINQALKIILEKRKASYFKGMQTSVQLFEIENYEAILSKLRSAYEGQYLDLKIKEILVMFCEQLNGSLTERGYGQYFIYSNRNATENEIEVIHSTIQQLTLETGASVSVGIGFGETLYSAESNAIEALNESKKQSDHKIVIIQETGKKIILPNSFGNSTKIANKDLIELLERSKINIKNFNLLVSLIKQANMEQFTVKDISTQLCWDKRNTQRFFNKLCEVGLLHISGEKYNTNKGRPSRLYHLNYSIY